LVGHSLAHFRIDAKLGEGGMGVVYRATDMKLGREVALKVLPRDVAGDDERRWRFLREARSAAAVTHPNIATVYEIGDADGDVFIAMELVLGETLRDKIARGLPHAESWRIAKEIARGLSRAHDKGVVHRDLKPENVMVTTDGEVKILDFGLAKLRDPSGGGLLGPAVSGTQKTMEGRVMGTPSYMSPEQAEGRADIDARSDVFSFGSMLYEMLAGVCPFEGGSNITILFAVIHQPPTPIASIVPDVPAALAAVIERCLAKDPAQRPSGGRELFAALGGETSQRSLQPLTGRAPPMPKDSVTSAAAMALGATVASDAAAFGTAPAAIVHPSHPGQGRSGAIMVVNKGLSRSLALAFGAVVLASMIGLALKQRRTRVVVSDGRSGTDAAMDSGPPSVTTMVDRPTPKVNNPEALAPYLTALGKLRVGGLGAMHDLHKATQIDSSFATAQIRVALYGAFFSEMANGERQTALSNANLFKQDLDDRDQALLPVAAVVTPSPVNFDAAASLLRDIGERFPNDVEVALLRYLYLTKRHRPPSPDLVAAQSREVDEAAARVRTLDPGATQVIRARVQNLMGNGRYVPGQGEDPLPVIAECLKTAPDATGCKALEARAFLDTGRCADLLADAHDLAAREPEEPEPYYLLASALASTLASPEGVKSALHQENDFIVPTSESPKGMQDLFFDLATGNFTATEAAELETQKTTALGRNESRHAALVAFRIALAEETGGRPRPLVLANAFLNHSEAWNLDAPREVRMRRLYLMRDAGKLNGAAFETARDALIAEEVARVAKPGAAEATVATEEERAHLKLEADARYTEAASQAKAALANVTARAVLSVRRGYPLDLGRLYLLAGRVDDALPLLKQESQRCEAVGRLRLDAPNLLATINFMHAHLLYGQALEAKQEKASACSAYGVVQTLWQNAKPRSVTLDKAKERSRALGCPATPPRGG
jgi:eukaryotic-like serine/threonine-protein kinase